MLGREKKNPPHSSPKGKQEGIFLYQNVSIAEVHFIPLEFSQHLSSLCLTPATQSILFLNLFLLSCILSASRLLVLSTLILGLPWPGKTSQMLLRLNSAKLWSRTSFDTSTLGNPKHISPKSTIQPKSIGNNNAIFMILPVYNSTMNLEKKPSRYDWSHAFQQ